MDRQGGGLVFDGGLQNRGAVVRVGDTVRRRRGAGGVVVEALLIHLEQAGFDGSPRFDGIDDQARQILEFPDRSTHRSPPWQHDGAANAVEFGRLAAWPRRLHDAPPDFAPPAGGRLRRRQRRAELSTGSRRASTVLG